MINNFTQFLNSINEGYIGSSGAFLYKLKKVYKQDKGRIGRFARAIYEIIKDREYINDNEIKQNFFHITDKPDMLTFIQHNKLPETWDEDNDYEDYLPYSLNRNEMKVGRIIKYLCGFTGITPKITDKELEEFVNIYKATNDTKLEFKLVKGDDIAKYYDEDKYFNGQGSLGNSCMGDASKKMLKIYSKNENKVQLLIYVDDADKVHGRALLWKLSTSPCDAKYFMDRVYTNSAVDEIRFRQFADEKGFLYKKYMNSYIEKNVNFVYKGKDVNGIITVKLDGNCKKYPFLDTLTFLNSDKDMLCNIANIDNYKLHDTIGGCNKCLECYGKMIINKGFLRNRQILCLYCGSGHITLKECGIKTDINSRVTENASGDWIFGI